MNHFFSANSTRTYRSGNEEASLWMRRIVSRMMETQFLQLATGREWIKADPSITGTIAIRNAAREARISLAWIQNDDDHNPFSYLNCCEILGLSVIKGRIAANKIVESPEYSIEIMAERQANGKEG